MKKDNNNKSSGNILSGVNNLDNAGATNIKDKERPQTEDLGERTTNDKKVIHEDDKSTIPSSNHLDKPILKDDKKSLDYQAKMKERLNRVLVNVDSAPDFTKDVSSLLQTNPSDNLPFTSRGNINDRHR